MSRNIELLKQVRDAISAENSHFNMNDWFTPAFYSGGAPACNTPSCIAGHTIAIAYPYSTYIRMENNIFESARLALGLTNDEASWLFYGLFDAKQKGIEHISKSQAIYALSHLIDGEEIQKYGLLFATF